MTLALVESTDFSTRVEYKQVNAVPKELLHKLEPFKLIGRKYYYNESKELNWFQAAQECRKLGANLINLATNEERQLIGLNLDNGQKYWMDFSNLGQKEYVSISTGSMITYAKWIDEDDSDDSVNKLLLWLRNQPNQSNRIPSTSTVHSVINLTIRIESNDF
ncbi:hypothetical protein ACLKA6_013208 [Drosophila palustris]